MEPQPWGRAKDVFELALRRTGADRDTFVADACGADRELRAAVEWLLASSGAPPSVVDDGSATTDRAPGLAGGTRLGPYEILALIGAGGMGEVYKARDTRLHRIVAIKILRPHHSADPDRRRRFEREAQAVAALAHPHICVLHDVGHHEGTDFLVMEYLDGQTLADRLRNGPLPVDDVLRVAIETADALDTAHGAGIVHRDLKPGNIMLTKSGTKLLDFGLAKLRLPVLDDARTTATAHDSPLTAKGTILGTLPYMAPEQLKAPRAMCGRTCLPLAQCSTKWPVAVRPSAATRRRA